LPRAPGDNFLLVYIVAYGILAVASPSGPTVVRALGRSIEGPLLFLTIRYLRPSRRQLWYCAAAILAAATVMGVVALIERLGPHQGLQTWYGADPPAGNSSFFYGTNGYRAGSFLSSPLILAFYLAGVVPLAVAVATLRSRWRLAVLLALAATAGGLLVTLTRSGLIGGSLGTLVVLSIAVRKPRIRASILGLVVVTATAFTVASLTGGSQTLIRSSATSGHRAALQRDLLLVEARPFGYGLGTTDALQQRFQLASAPGATESTYMAKALEGGIPALLLYLLVLFITGMRVRSARRRAIRTGDRQTAILAAGALGAMVGIGLAGLFLGIQELVVEVILWGVPGIALASAASGAAIPSQARSQYQRSLPAPRHGAPRSPLLSTRARSRRAALRRDR
jgi:O-antigen ligase/polysaccharide polymerase Wzy-like membrane protein